MKTTQATGRQISIIVIALITLLGAMNIQATAFVGSVTGDWSATATWGGSGPPGASDTVTINAGITVTVSDTRSVTSIVLNRTTGNTTKLAISGTGNLTVSAGAAITQSGSAGTASVDLTGGAGILNFSGTGTPVGAIVTLTAGASGSTVNYSGGAQTVNPVAYQNLTLSGSGAKTMTSVTSISNLIGSGTCTSTLAGGTTVSGNLGISGATITTANSTSALNVTGTTTISSGTLNLNGSSFTGTFTGAFLVSGGTFNSNGGAPTFAGSFTFSSGTLTDSNGASAKGWIFANGSSINGGTFTIPSAVFIPLGATVVNNATGLTIGGNSGSNPWLAKDSSGAAGGTWTQGTSSSLSYGGSTPALTVMNCTDNIPNTVTYTKSGVTAKATTYYNVQMLPSSTGGASLSGSTVSNNLTIGANVNAAITFPASPVGGTFTYSGSGSSTFPSAFSIGTLSQTAGTLVVSSAQTLSVTGTGGNTFTRSAGTFTTTGSTVAFTGAAPEIAGAAATTFNSLALTNATGATLTTAPTVNGTLTLAAGAVTGNLTLGNGATVVRGSGSLSGTVTFGTSVNVTYNNSVTTGPELPTTAIVSGLIVSNASGVTLGGNSGISASGTLNLASGQLNLNGNTLTLSSGATISLNTGSLSAAPAFGANLNVTYTGSTAATIGARNEIPSGGSLGTGLLTVNNTGGCTLDSTVGTVSCTGGAIGSGATLAVTTGGVLKNAGTFTPTGTLSFTGTGKYQHNFTTTAGVIPAATWATTSTCEIINYTSDTSAPTGLGQSFGNFTWNCASQTGNINLGGALVTVNGNFTVASLNTATLRLASSQSPTLAIGGNLNIQQGTLEVATTTGSPTINVAGDLAMTGGTLDLANGGSTGTVTLNVSGNVSVPGGATLKKTTAAQTGKINFARSGTQTFTSGGTISGAIGWTVNSSSTLDAGTSVISGSGTFNLSSGAGIITAHTSGLNGNITVSGTKTFSAGANYTYNGTSLQGTGSQLPVTVNNLTITNSAGVTLSASVTVTNVLALATGVVATAANILILSNAAAISGGNSGSYVDGQLRKQFNTGAGQAFTFHVGKGSVYRPVTLANMTVITAGNLTVTNADGDEPNAGFGPSGIDTNKSVNSYWVITTNTSGGLVASTYDITLNYANPGDLDAGANAANFAVQKWDGSLWTGLGISAQTSTSITATNAAAFGDFAAGEPRQNTTPAFSSLTASPSIAYAVTSITLSGTVSSTGGYPANGETVSASINGHVVNGTVTNSTGAFSITYNDASLATDGVGGSPYTITYAYAGNSSQFLNAATDDTSTTLTVNPRALSITADDDSKTYGGTRSYGAGSTVFTSSGLQNGETIGSVTIEASGGTAATDGTNTFTLTPSAATGGTFDGSNYSISYNPGTLTVNPLAVSLTGSRTYDGTTNAAAEILSVVNAVNGDIVSVASGIGGLTGKDAGSRPITFSGTLVLGGPFATNYTLTGASGSVAISVTNITVTAATNTKSYDGTTDAGATPVVTAGSVQIGDTASFTESYNDNNVGTDKTLTPAGTVTDGNGGNNYNYTYEAVVTGVINPATTSVSVTSTNNPSGYKDSVVFTATLPADATTAVNFLTNGVFFDTGTLSGGTATVTNSSLPRGTNTITVEYAGDDNYLGSTNNLSGGQVVTNHPPMTSLMTVTRSAGMTLKIALSDMATNWSDLDGDSVSLTNINLTTTNGVTMILLNVTTNSDGSYIITNAAFLGYVNGSNVADQLSYTITDGFGGTTVGYVNIAISTGQVFGQGDPQIISTNGGVQLTFYGVPDYTYIVQRNLVALNSPVDWLDFSTNTAPTNSPVIIIMDTNNPQAFYRLKWQP